MVSCQISVCLVRFGARKTKLNWKPQQTTAEPKWIRQTIIWHENHVTSLIKRGLFAVIWVIHITKGAIYVTLETEMTQLMQIKYIVIVVDNHRVLIDYTIVLRNMVIFSTKHWSILWSAVLIMFLECDDIDVMTQPAKKDELPQSSTVIVS
ncbi:hypothetical protein RF11_09916 [Thelohanellus kitauei]|uniref:Uncharacterized protein n=1 Tax=Thelohanellus kitauei TaxID=669202 RepID=A0A0C2N5Y5_THEKT|nr:hypothetical protein RF11_09916 [Thelohanellus kitauei]